MSQWNSYWNGVRKGRHRRVTSALFANQSNSGNSDWRCPEMPQLHNRQRRKDKPNDSKSTKDISQESIENDDNLPEQTPWLPDVTVSSGISILVAALYIKTLHPSVPGGDGGELIVAAHELGVAHPPGYPLFTLLSWLAIKIIPYGSVAWRVNLLNALFTAASSGLLMLTTLRVTSSFIPAGIFAVSIFSTSKLTWLWGTGAEVFSLNNFFISAILLCCVYFENCPKGEKVTIACLGSFMCGLALCNQHTIVVYAVTVAVWVLNCLKSHQLLSVQSLIYLTLSAALGLLPYVHLPISASNNQSRWTWGDQRSLSGILTHVLRQEYGTFDLGKDHVGSSFYIGVREYVKHAMNDMLYVGPVLAVVAFLIAWRRKRLRQGSVLFVFQVMFLIYMFLFTWRANLDLENPLFRGVVERFWLQSDLVLAVFGGVGFYAVFRIFSWGGDMLMNTKVVAWTLSIAAIAVQLQLNFQLCDQSSNTVIRDYAKTILKSMPKNAVIFTKGDLPSLSLRYFHLCENARPDMTILDVEVLSYRWSLDMTAKFYPKLVFPGDFWNTVSRKYHNGMSSFNFKHLLDVNYKMHPMFVCVGMQERDKSWSPQYELVPFGNCHKIVRAHDEDFNVTKWFMETKNMAKTWKYKHDMFPPTSWEQVANGDMWQAKMTMAFYMYDKAGSASDEGEKLELYLSSYKLYKRIIEANNNIGFPAYWHKNFGLACEKLLRYEGMHRLKTSTLLRQSLEHLELYLKEVSDDPQQEAINGIIKYLRKQHVHLETKETCSGDEAGPKNP